jgi:zinc protease
MEEFELDSRLKVICVADHEQNGLVVAVQLPVGRFSDPPGSEGLCGLTANLLTKGTVNVPAEEFSRSFENAGAMLFVDDGEEYCVLGMRSRAAAGVSLLPLFVEMISRPLLAGEEFVRLRREMTTSLKSEAADPYLIASRHFYAELAGDRHPAGRLETVQSIKKITVDQVRSFYNDFFSSDGSLCIIAGDLDGSTLRELARAQFSPWRRSPPKKTTSARQPYGRPAAIRLIDKPDLTQATLVIGHACPGERNPEKNALLLANHILGGGNFSSRLMARLRSEAGKTYGISSQLNTETDFGAFMISTSTQNRELGTVLAGILEEYRRFCSDGVTDAELEKAKRFAIGHMAFQLEGIGNVVDKLLWLRFYGRPNSYIEKFEELISSIDLAAVNDAIRRYLSPEDLIITAVGKKSEIEKQLKVFGAVKNYHFRDKA